MTMIVIKNYCIIVSMQKIISIHQFILEIQPILVTHNLSDNTHF